MSALRCQRCDACGVPSHAYDVPGGDQPFLSVRGEVERLIPPDSAELSSWIEIVRDSKDDAFGAATIAVDSVCRALRERGGVVNEVASLREPLRWAVRRVSATPQFEPGKVETGRFVGAAQITIYVRDFELLETVEQLASSVAGFRITWAQWNVDSDNPAWGDVRLEAIEAAIGKGRDYATALRSRLLGVEHVADLGLLGADHASHLRGASATMAAGGASGGSLDPVPQSIRAAVEARFRIAPVPLG